MMCTLRSGCVTGGDHFCTVDAHADFVLICDYTGKEVVE